MSKSPFGIYVLSAVILFSLAGCDTTQTVTPPPTHTYYVSTIGSDTNDCLSEDTACLTLATAVEKATPNSTINIAAGDFPSHVNLEKFVTITGAGLGATRLIADSTSPVLTVADDVHVSLFDLEIRGGNVIGGGPNGIEVHGNNIATRLEMKSVNIDFTHTAILSPTGSAVAIVDCSLENNDIGISITGGTLNISSSFITGSATLGILNAALAVLDAVQVTGNGSSVTDPTTAFAISNTAVTRPTGSSSHGSLEIHNSTIASNHEGGIGSIGPGSISIIASTIESNSGSGIQFTAETANLTVDDSVVRTNSGVGIYSASANFQVNRSAITENGRAGLMVPAGTTIITNATIAGNRDAGVYTYGLTTLAYDTIAYNGHSGLLQVGPDPVVLTDTIIALNSGGNCTSSDPAFVITQSEQNLACNDSQTNDYYKLGGLVQEPGSDTYVVPLTDGSPAIDSATGTCPAKDQRGFDRPVGGTCDIGAYEFGAGAHLTFGTASPATPTLPGLQIASDTPTQVPLEIVTDTPTTPSTPQVTLLSNANCRKGPGSAYNVATSFAKGQTLDAVGRNTDSSWWQVELQPGSFCWVGNATVSTSGPVDQLPVVTAPGLPDAPAKFTGSNVCDPKMGTLMVSLNWASVAGATGFNLYRNGTLLTSFGPGTTTYMDNAPVGVDLVYAVESINVFGYSAQITDSVPACK